MNIPSVAPVRRSRIAHSVLLADEVQQEQLPELSVVVPCFNEAASMDELIRRLTPVARNTFGDQYEIILVDDGSCDGTWERITFSTNDDPHIVGVKLSRNHGHQLALMAGLSTSRGRYVLVIDADLQDAPEHLAEMYALMLREDADVVYGRRRIRAGETALKRGTAALFYRLLASVTDVDIPVDAGDFRLMSRRVTELLTQMPERDRLLAAWLLG